MELTEGQRRLAFVVTVLVLAGLGAFLLRPGARAHEPGHAAATSRASAAASTTPGAVAAATPSPVPVPTGSVDIYRWLPFSQSDLAAAAAVTEKFGAERRKKKV